MKQCTKCGGSWMGRPYDTECEHDFDEAPEPSVQKTFRVLNSEAGGPMRYERSYVAEGAYVSGDEAIRIHTEHPLRDGAIAAWKAEWVRRRDNVRKAREELGNDRGIATVDEDGELLTLRIVIGADGAKPDAEATTISTGTFAAACERVKRASWLRPLLDAPMRHETGRAVPTFGSNEALLHYSADAVTAEDNRILNAYALADRTARLAHGTTEERREALRPGAPRMPERLYRAFNHISDDDEPDAESCTEKLPINLGDRVRHRTWGVPGRCVAAVEGPMGDLFEMRWEIKPHARQCVDRAQLDVLIDGEWTPAAQDDE